MPKGRRILIVAILAGVTGLVVPETACCADTPLAQLTAARAAPCSTAIIVYKSLSVDTTVPDTIRSRACGLLGDYAFAQREYETALDYYKKASALDKTNARYIYRTGLSHLADGDTADAIKRFVEAAGMNGPELPNEARVNLGRISYARGDYKGAMDYFRQTGSFSPTNGWSVSASFGKLMCARELGLADTAAFYEKQCSPYAKTLLERDGFVKTKGRTPIKKSDTATPAGERIVVDSGKKPAATKPVDSVSAPFALQVGAFGSETSALALKKKLSKSFSDVRSVSAIVSARTFYRVWVGNFKTREAAEKFGRAELLELGLVYRVVAK